MADKTSPADIQNMPFERAIEELESIIKRLEEGKVPLAELDDYQGRLKSLTGGQGSYSIAFSHYAPVPASTQQQLASQFKVVALDDD